VYASGTLQVRFRYAYRVHNTRDTGVYTHYPVIFKVAKFRGQSGASGLIALEVETNYASFDFHIRVLFFRFGNSLLYYIKLGTSV
jgi:hypothetical protein